MSSPEDIANAIRDNDLLDATGVYGDPLAGDPAQIDELVLESETHRVEITVYNRCDFGRSYSSPREPRDPRRPL